MNPGTKVVRLLLATLILGCAPMPAQPAATVAGSPAPNLPLHFLDGSRSELGSWLGSRPVYLKLWATWCSTCRAEMPQYRELFGEYGQEVAFFSVNAGLNDTVAEVREFNARYGLEMPTVIDADGRIGQAFGLVATPMNILIDDAGTVVYLSLGADEGIETRLAELGRAPGSAHSVSALPPPGVESRVPMESDPAPLFSVTTSSGAGFTLADSAALQGPTYLLFFTTWCESYLAGDGEEPETARACQATRQALDAAFADPDQQPRVLGIASRMWTGPEELAEYGERYRPAYPIALDETNDIFQSYGVRQFPTLVVIVDGRIQRRLAGGVTELPEP